MKRIAAFDFDGTITRKDTLIEFLRFAGGSARLYAVFALYSPLLVLMKLKLYSNQKAKEKIFAHYFKGMPIEQFDDLCRRFFEQQGQALIYTDAKAQIAKHKEHGDEVVVISASIENWVRHFADALRADKLLATQIEVQDGKITGCFLSANCYGQEKVKRLLSAYPDRNNCYLIAYGDSRGDKELLHFADEQHYRQFDK
jgi:HAD superfamily hydrolase (TIGR01490 family)